MFGIYMSSYNKENSNNLPRGLFFDLTDGFNNDESNFDIVQGFIVISSILCTQNPPKPPKT